VLEAALEFEPVRFAFNGIRAGVIALIVKAVVTMAKKCPWNTLAYALAAIAFVLATFTGVNVLYLIFGGALVGLFSAAISRKGESK
jgi:chromate transporter